MREALAPGSSVNSHDGYNGATMKRVGVGEARDRLSALINDAAHGNQRILIESRGRIKAALIGLRDLEQLERIAVDTGGSARVMLRWLEEAQKALKGPKQRAGTTLEALREIREEKVAEAASVYRRKRRPKASRRRRG